MNRRSFIARLCGAVAAAALIFKTPELEEEHLVVDIETSPYFVHGTKTGRVVFYQYPNSQAPLTGLLTNYDAWLK